MPEDAPLAGAAATRSTTDPVAASSPSPTPEAAEPPAPAPAPYEPETAIAEPVAEPAVFTAPRSRPSLVGRILEHPDHAPALLALAAVDALGPGAQAWMIHTRSAYPTATTLGLARLATQRHVRLARASGAVAVAAGLFTPLVELAAVSWAQVNLLLHLAAAYGHDPTDHERAADLLMLARFQEDAASAGAAIAAAKAAVSSEAGSSSIVSAQMATGDGLKSLLRMLAAAWQLATPLVTPTAGWLAARMAARLVPGATMLAAAAESSAATERLAARAIAHYRITRADPR